MLKLYKDRPLCINNNIDVPNCLANGAMCKFVGIELKDEWISDSGYSRPDCMEKILIDGYYVNCIDADKIEHLIVQMIDGNDNPNNPKIVRLKAMSVTTEIRFPATLDGIITSTTKRMGRKLKMKQFPVNIANARTVHKLQGRSIRNLVISSWNHRGNWIYVVLSRCSTLNGIFTRRKLTKTRPMSAENRAFHIDWRKNKAPPYLKLIENRTPENPYERPRTRRRTE
jgi:hypothetical protein